MLDALTQANLPARRNDTLVLKFGGTSVGSPERILAVAQIIAQHRQRCERVVVVVSAMGDTTDELIELAQKVSPHCQTPRHRREMDMLLTAGERVSMALVSMALGDLGVNAISLTGSQSGIITDTIHGEARIAEIKPFRIEESLEKGRVVIVAGFQGVSREKEVTTLGRGGSDTSAVALGIVLGARETVIYTDVDGFYSADPRIVKSPRALEAPGWDLAVEAAYRGAQVLHPRCVELAWTYKMPVRVCSSFKTGTFAFSGGTLIQGESMSSLEGPRVLTVALHRNLVLVQKKLKENQNSSTIFSDLNQLGLKVLAWTQTFEDLSLLVEESQCKTFEQQLAPERKVGGLARVSMIGVGLSHAADVQRRIQDALNQTKLRLVMSRISPTAIELVVENKPTVEDLVRGLHEEFVE
jgi:aspartate kinase